MTVYKLLSTLVLSMTLLAMKQAHAKSATRDEWQFTLAPMFLWGVSMKGTARFEPLAVPLNLEFQDDAMNNLEAVFTWHFEIRKSDFALFVEHQYIDLVPTTALATGEQVNVGFKNIMVELASAYTLLKSAGTDWQILGGIRLTKQLLSINEIPSPASPVTSFNTDQRWTDVFIGGRVYTGITGNWKFIGRADVGAGGSDRVWNIVGMLDYTFTNWSSVFFGYRVLDYDYDNGEPGSTRYAFDGRQQGPLVGISFNW